MEPSARLVLREAYLRPAARAEFNGDGSRLLVRAADGGGAVWDLTVGVPVTGAVPPAETVPDGNVFGPGGGWLAQIKPDGAVEIRDIRSFDTEHRLAGHAGGTSAVVFDEGGRLLFSGGADGKLRVWDVASGTLSRTLEHGAPVTGVAVLPGRNRLASTGADGSIRIWDRSSFEVVANQLDPGGGVVSLSAGPDGRLLATVSADGAVRLRDGTSAALLATLASTRREGDWLVAGPTGWFDGTGEALTRLAEWESARIAARLDALAATYYRPGVLGEILSGVVPEPKPPVAQADLRAPTVELVSTEIGGEEDSWFARVKLAVTPAGEDAGVRDLLLFRDNALAKTWDGMVARASGRTVVETDVPIGEDEVRLSAYALNLDGVRSETVSTVIPSEAPASQPLAHVVVVGINAHRLQSLNLQEAVASATEFAEGVRTALEGTRRFREVRVTRLTNRDATRESIGQALSTLVSEARAGDAVFLFFSGNVLADRRDLALLTHDGEARFDQGISAAELTRVLQRIASRWLVVVLDSRSDDPAAVTHSPALARLSLDAGCHLLVASSRRDEARASIGRLLGRRGLSTAAADVPPANGMIDLREWLSWSQREAASRAASRLYLPNRPERSWPLVVSKPNDAGR